MLQDQRFFYIFFFIWSGTATKTVANTAENRLAFATIPNLPKRVKGDYSVPGEAKEYAQRKNKITCFVSPAVLSFDVFVTDKT